MNLTNLLLVGVVCLAATTSCMRDDLGECPDPYNVRLAITTDYEQENAQSRAAAPVEWYYNTIESVTAYVFDSEGVYHSSWSGGAYRLGDGDYTIPMMLPEGADYQFVVFSNCGLNYGTYRQGAQLQGVRIEDLRMALMVPDGSRTFTEDIQHQHRGQLSRATVRAASSDTPVGTVVLQPQTYRVNFTVTGVDTDDIYDMTVIDKNAAQGFGGGFSSGRTGEEGEYRHVRTMQSPTRAGEDLAASMVLLRIGDDTGTSFSLDAHSGNFSYGKDLLETIKAAYRLDEEEELEELLSEEYDYDIDMEFTPLGVNIAVNGWEYRDNSTNVR